MREHASLRTAEVARAAGVNVETLRYYERRGILREPPRRPSGHREYPADSVGVVRFVKRAQGLGFTLGEVAELLRLRDDRARGCAAVCAAARAKVADIDRKVKE